jgi:SAM-dependent methyltransferase
MAAALASDPPVLDVDDPGAVAFYDDLSLWSAPCGLLLLDQVDLRAARRVLDVGCGTGFPLVELAQRLGPAARAWGVDVWRVALRRAHRRVARLGVGNAGLVEGNAERLPFAAGSFDLVVSNLGINNFERPERALAECARVSRQGAALLLSTNLRGSFKELYVVYRRTLLELGRRAEAAALDAHIAAARRSIAEIGALLSGAGFAVARVARASFRLRFRDGTALLHHSFVRLAFREAWESVVAPEARLQTMQALEQRLNEAAAHRGLVLTVPMA